MTTKAAIPERRLTADDLRELAGKVIPRNAKWHQNRNPPQGRAKRLP